MPRLPRSIWAWLLLAFTGCSLVTDFDRDRLGAHPGSDDGGSVNSPMDAQTPDPGPGPGTDATMSGGGDVDSAVPAACQTHADCGRDRLCCSGACLPVTQTNCSDCGQGCSETAANTCNDRVCGCGEGPACSGTTPHCTGADAAASCVQCRDVGDCSAGQQCVQGKCAQCNPVNNSGCNGTTPICNPNTLRCEACRASPDNCPGDALVCTPSGACGGCTANDAADCTSPTTPICDLSANPSVCRGCMSNAECMTELSLPYCINNERCSACNPVDDTGCAAGSATPDCRPNANGVYQCQGCMNGTCGTGQVCNLTSGRCVQCRSDNDCDTNSATPWCDPSTGTCRGCNLVPSAGGNAWCSSSTRQQTPQRNICHSTGRCIRCDATGGCPNNQRCFIPDAAAPQNNMCGACRPNVAGDCPAGMPICDAATRMCRGCRTGDCTGATPMCNTMTGSCVRCIVEGSGAAAGCPNANQSRCIMGTAGPECVQCSAHPQCPPGGPPLCHPTSHTCVLCTAFPGNPAAATAACQSRTQGTVCTNAGTCATCDPMDHDGCAGNQLCCNGACTATGPTQCEMCGMACLGICENRDCRDIVPDAGLPISLPGVLDVRGPR